MVADERRGILISGPINQYRPCFVQVLPAEVVRYPVSCVMDFLIVAKQCYGLYPPD